VIPNSRSSSARSPACGRGARSTPEAARGPWQWRWAPATPTCASGWRATNVRIARQLNRFKNVDFRPGLAEEVHLLFPAASFDLVYSFAVLEHVRDVNATVRAIETVLRPGGRFAFVVPMHELRARGPIPDYAPVHGYADHCRVFTEAELRARFGGRKGFRLVKIPGAWKHGELPDCFEPIEFGSFFVSYATD